MRLRRSPTAFACFGLLIVLLLAGCAAGEGEERGYPELSSVPSEPRPSLPVEERREIVRGLIKERDESRRQTSIVRGRSGLSISAFETLGDNETDAAAIIPDEPTEVETFSLRGENESEGDASSTYRSGAQFDDGSLDDFIRQLERDTSPDAPAVLEEPTSEEPLGDETSFFLFETNDAPPVMLAAFAPAFVGDHPVERDVRIRLAAAEDEPGFVCTWFGWAVGWSGACTRSDPNEPETNAQPDSTADVESNDQGDVEGEADRLRQAENADSGGISETDEPVLSRREQAERRLSEEDASEAIENLGRGALEPVKSSLEKLRDFMRARRSADPDASPAERRAYRSRGGTSSEQTLSDYPPVPQLRPKGRETLYIHDGGEKFAFKRLSPPAFKPTAANEPVILPAPGLSISLSEEFLPTPKKPVPASKQAQPYDAERFPEFRPDDLVGQDETPEIVAPPLGTSAERERLTKQSIEEIKGAQEEALSDTKETESSDQTTDLAALPPLSESDLATQNVDEGFDWSSPLFIELEPGSSYLSTENMARLDEVLTYARANGQKILVIGEAGTSRLASRRATEVGAALVRLSATAEILEYDFNVVSGVDRVRLEILTPKPEDVPEP